MKTILVTGSNGLLGQKIIYRLRSMPDTRCISTSRGPNRMRVTDGYTYESLDITDSSALEEMLERHRPDSVIHTAALTNVDMCEAKKEEAWQMNVESVQNLVTACRKYHAHLVHLSTDFVFDGEHGPYIESDEPNPLSYYALTKYEAEQRILSSGIPASILRTIIIYGVVDDNSRSNVVLWTVNSLRAGKEIRVINDQFRSPTLSEDLAQACVSAAIKKAIGIYHVSGRELMCMLDIVRITADYFELNPSFIKPVTSAELNQSAKRPPVTGFILDKAMKELDYRPHSFLDGLALVKKQLLLVAS